MARRLGQEVLAVVRMTFLLLGHYEVQPFLVQLAYKVVKERDNAFTTIRYETPFHHYCGQNAHSHGLPTAPKDHLCEACLRTPFGTGMTGEYEKPSSSDTTRLSLVYPKESEELRTSAEEGANGVP